MLLKILGMSNFEQLKENIKTFEEDKPLNKEEWNTLLSISSKMLEKKILPCTACHYCSIYQPNFSAKSFIASEIFIC